MFAVPGWSLSSDLLKREEQSSQQDSKSSKKRKRLHHDSVQGGPAQSATSDVASETRNKMKQNEKASKFEKNSKGNDSSHKDLHGRRTSKPVQRAQNEDFKSQMPGNRRKSPSQQTKDTPQREPQVQRGSKKVTSILNPVEDNKSMGFNAPSTKSSQLTPLQQAMRQKLMGAHFRHLNESLYTSPSSESLKMFEMNPTFFDEYHSGYRQQVSTWPQNPVETYIQELETRTAGASEKGGKKGASDTNEESQGTPEARSLPKKNGVCKIADMGCGDARLAESVQRLLPKAKIRVFSYDFYSSNENITKADIANLPLKSDSVNVAVLCLALMGTNWLEFVEEAWRVLHWKGELWVAEIKSRFAKPKKKTTIPSEQNFIVKSASAEKRRQQQMDDELLDERALTEIDGSAKQQEKTDVSAFVQVLKNRGFAMENEKAVDFSNKMFVRMRFYKSLTPVKGKHANQGNFKNNTGRKQQRRASVDVVGDDDNGNEAAVLKPCLYKTR